MLDAELVEVDVGNAEARKFGAEVAGFETPMRAEGFLQREIPLLRVAAAVVALDGENALAEAGVRTDIRGADVRAGGEEEGGAEVIEGLFADGPDEGKEGSGEGSRNAGLFDPGEAVAGAQDEIVAELEGETEARGEVTLFEIAGGTGMAIAAEEAQALRVEIKNGAAVAEDGGGEVEGITKAEIEGEAAVETPVVLEKGFGDGGAGAEGFGLEVKLVAGDLAGEKRGEAMAGVGQDGAGGEEGGGEEGRELKVAGGVGGLENVEGLEAEVDAELDGVGAAGPGEVVEKLRHAGCEAGGGVGGRTDFLVADDVVSRKG